ncbi:NADH dehydrogenase subunit 2 (mitochondrion) [Kryptolebias marmoratus]|uniref:NADH-ubiquinone oxidoreductase chain 2 n=1 Tax=Kryptolebias marmoratus TaxID=37003 RepID=Q8WEA8_KRYMA|nr:NADH dehydrogenase subunit 2 [Kryptolebias marmoratus]AAL38114.1 NADH dehydrogenase subunit 2 [Kryptolebias marmoratus]AAY24598.1 NADH dehydrogenase subunit 2 [Kryptolebias marmoratus]ALV90057.1 NADH dehydrogenase subunit 2 [Kryptolebias marmoratus]
MSPYMLIILIFTLGLGTLITLSSSHWLIAWMGLELNTFAILPLMAQQHSPRAMEATIKYFIIQTTAATMLLFASVSNAWLSGQWEIQQMSHPTPLALITIALALKLGLAPMHAWFPEVLQGLNFSTGLILSTWQKLAPFSLLLQIPPTSSFLLITLGFISVLMGGWGGLNQTQLRKILGYSSIAHLGWMILIMQYAPPLTLLALTVYIVLTSSMFLTFLYNQATNINSLAISWTKTPMLTALTPLVLLSLGGLPPLTGFLPKWAILQELTKQGLTPVAALTALSALLSLYFYLRLSYATALTTPPNNLPATLPWRIIFKQPTTFLAVLITMSLSLLPLSPSVMAFFTF